MRLWAVVSRRYAVVFIFLVTSFFSAAAQTNAAVLWDSTVLEAVRNTRLAPPAVARALAIVHTCMYDAWAAYDDRAIGTRLGDTLRRPQSERTLDNKQRAVSFAAYRCATDLFPSQVDRFDAVMTGLGYDQTDASIDTTTPTGIGNRAASEVLLFRHADGSNQLGDLNPGPYTDWTGYAPVNTWDQINDPDRWQPLRVPGPDGTFTIQTYAVPHWGEVKPFAMTSGAEFRPNDGPIWFRDDPDKYAEQAELLLWYSRHLTDRTKMIAEYWADGPNSETPPGHWCLFAQFVSARDHHTLDDDVKMFFALANAVMDAGIAAWDAKRVWDSVRPITAVHFLFAGTQVTAWRGPNLGIGPIDGAQWQPYQAPTLVTPPFPEYVSGHSTFSAAGAEVLRLFTGRDDFGFSIVIPAGSSKFEQNVPATDLTFRWDSFSDAADEAGESRRWGGIHFPTADLTGRAMGRRIGENAWRKAVEYFDPDTHGGKD